MKGEITIDTAICKGCGLCVRACPKDIIQLNTKQLNDKGYPPAVCIKAEECIGCASCANMCPECAIEVKRKGRDA